MSFSTQGGSLDRAKEHAAFLAAALKRHGFKVANVWGTPRVGVRIYLPQGQFISVGRDGTITGTEEHPDRGRVTFRESLLWNSLRAAWKAARADHTSWHKECLAEEEILLDYR